MLLEPSREAELGSSPYFHPPASHHALQSSYPEPFPPLPPERSPSPKASPNFQAASAGFGEQVAPFPGRHGVSDRSRQTENEAHLVVEREEVSPSSLTSSKVCSSSSPFDEACGVAAFLTPHRKTKFNMVSSGSLPVLFPPSHPLQVPSDRKGLHSPCFKPSSFPEWPSAVQEGAYPAIAPISPSPLPHRPTYPLQTASRYLRAKSHESLHHFPEDLVNGESGNSEMITAKGHVRSLAEQFQRLQEKEGANEKERTVALCHDQRSPKLLQESFSSLPSLGSRQPIPGSLGNGIWPAENSDACLDSRGELSPVDCFTVHSITSKNSILHNEDQCSRGKPCAADSDFHQGRLNHKGEVRQMEERNPAGFVAPVPVDCWVDNVKRYYSSQQDCRKVPSASHPRAFVEDPMQKHPQWNQDTEQEISELESLYQASLQAPQTSRSVLGRLDDSWHPLGKTGKTAARYGIFSTLKKS